MSLLWTESFAGFRKGGVNLHADLTAAGYVVSGTDAEWRVADDMIVPNRVVLTSDFYGEESGSLVLSRVLPPYTAPIIMGFSVYVPVAYERPETDASPLLVFRTHEKEDEPGSEIYRVRRDLRVSLADGSPQNVARMTPARVHYVEVRVSLGEVRVWLDDVYVLQHTTVNQSPLAWSIELNEPGFSLGNLYVLNEDAEYPNVRLGRATRVIGERPTADSEVTFERPVNAETNAAVAGQDFVAEPPAVLQGTNVGDEDIYTVGRTDAESASTIHAVAVKVRAMNADVVPRAVSALVEVDGEKDVGSAHARFHYLEPFTDDDILCSAAVPGRGVVVGTKRGQVWFSENGEQFDCVSESGGSPINDVAVKDNVAVAVCENGRVIRGNFSVTPVAWTQVDTPANGTALRAIAASLTRLIAVGDNGTAIVSGTGDADTWFRVTTGTTDDLTAVSYADDHWVIAGSFDDNSLRVSLNDGDNWIPPGATKPEVEGPLRIRTLNGRTIVMGSGATPIASRLAIIGFNSPFYAATKIGGLADPGRCVDCIVSDDVFLFALEDGTTLVSEDALVCQLSEKLDMQITTMARLDDGRVLVAGKEGRMFLRAVMPAVTELPVLSGYVNGYTTVTRDPSTGMQWTPLAAALANIGVRIVDVPAYGDTGNYLLTENGLRLLDEYGRKILLEDFTK